MKSTHPRKMIGLMASFFAVAIIAFYIGTLVGGRNSYIAGSNNILNGGNSQRLGRGFAGERIRGAGLNSGEIIAKDDKSITIKMPDGSSKIVFYSNQTQTMKSTIGTVADLFIGEQVMVSGPTNSDGSVNAQTIQIRSAGSWNIFGGSSSTVR